MAKNTKALEVLIDQVHDVREQIRGLTKEVNALKTKKEDLEARLLETMDALGTDQSRSKVATATVTELVVPHVEDWEAFYKYITRTKSFYMLERRPAPVAYRETLEQRKGKAIPGVTSFTKRTIGLRARG